MPCWFAVFLPVCETEELEVREVEVAGKTGCGQRLVAECNMSLGSNERAGCDAGSRSMRTGVRSLPEGEICGCVLQNCPESVMSPMNGSWCTGEENGHQSGPCNIVCT